MELGDLFDFEGPRRNKNRRDYDDGHSGRRASTQGEDEYPDARQGWQRRGHDDHGDDEEGLGFGHLGLRMPKLFANKKVLVLAAIVLVPLLVVAAYFLLPLVWQAVQFVEKNGVQGVINRFWKGSGS